MRCGGVCFACFDLRVWCLVYVFCDCCLCVCCCRIDGFVFILLIVFSLSDCGCVLRVRGLRGSEETVEGWFAVRFLDVWWFWLFVLSGCFWV